VAAKKNICPWCGIANPNDADVCIGCGSELNAQPRRDSETARAPVEVKPAAGAPRPQAPKSGTQAKSVVQPKNAAKHHERSRIEPGYVYAAIAAVVILGIFYLRNDNNPATPLVPQNTSLLQSDSTAQRIKSMEEFLASHPDDREASLEYANTLHDARQFPKAIAAYRQYLEHDPKNADARTDMAICLFESGDSPTAVVELKKVLEYAPKHQPAMFNLGVVYLNMEKLKESNEWFSRCAAVDPGTPIAARAKQLLSQHTSTNNNLQ
jgi:Flp pilus assembly protein TadD